MITYGRAATPARFFGKEPSHDTATPPRQFQHFIPGEVTPRFAETTLAGQIERRKSLERLIFRRCDFTLVATNSARNLKRSSGIQGFLLGFHRSPRKPRRDLIPGFQRRCCLLARMPRARDGKARLRPLRRQPPRPGLRDGAFRPALRRQPLRIARASGREG